MFSNEMLRRRCENTALQIGKKWKHPKVSQLLPGQKFLLVVLLVDQLSDLTRPLLFRLWQLYTLR
jgi:hypothetical protein